MPRTDSTDDTSSTHTDDGASQADSPSNDGPGDGGSTDSRPWNQRFHGERAIRAVSTVVFGALTAAVVLFLLSVLPGMEATEPAFTALASGVLALAFATIFGYLALFAPRFVRAGAGPRPLRESVASATVWVLVLTAILTVHGGFVPLAALLEVPTWLYDGLFFLLSIGPFVMVAVALWETIDPAASYLSSRLTGTR